MDFKNSNHCALGQILKTANVLEQRIPNWGLLIRAMDNCVP